MGSKSVKTRNTHEILVAFWILLASLWVPAFSETSIPARDRMPVAGALNHVALIPVAANSPGRFGAHYKTRVVIFNPTSRDYSITARLFGRNGPAGNSATIPINSGQYLAWENFLQEILDFEGSGAVIFSSPDEQDEFYMTAEVYTDSPNGRFSTTVVNGIIPLFSRGKDPESNVGISVNQNRRTNIGVFNIANEPSSIETKVFDASGTMVETIGFELNPFSWQQKSINALVDNGHVRWEINGPSESHYFYAVEVDNRSNDGTLTWSVKGSVTSGGEDSGGGGMGIPPAPEVAPRSGTNTVLEVIFRDSFEAGETRAYDFQLRTKTPRGPWGGSCNTITNSSSRSATVTITQGITGLKPGTVYEARYRYRNSTRCASGSPGQWSDIGEGATSSEATGMNLEFSEGESTTRRIFENIPPGINVGAPVSAVGGDSLNYTISGTDAESFIIVPGTGQVRTREGVTYDYETKNRYFVTVGVEDDADNTDTIDVTILIGNLVPLCEPPSNLRTNNGDQRLTLRWKPLSNMTGHAPVLGYQTEIRRGSSGAWSDRRSFLGRNITGMIYADLTNGIGYQVRVRPINSEGDCGWSTPVLGIPTADLAPKDPGGPLDRFGPQPVGTPERHFQFLAPERCRHTSNGQTLDADCEYDNIGPDSGRIFLEFDDPSQGSCEITLVFSSLTTGSFNDECFDAGINTNVPFDRSFRMPRLAPRTEDDLDPPNEGVPQLAPRNQDEFDTLVFGRDDFIPGLCFGNCLLGDPPERGVARQFHIDANGDFGEEYGDYTYENNGPSQGVLTFALRGGDTWVFTLDFEPSGNVRVTITDPDGNDAVWPGSLHEDLTLGAQPILLPIPPSWSAAIAIETDVAPEDWNGLEALIPTPSDPAFPISPRDNLLERTLFGGLSESLFKSERNCPDGHCPGVGYAFGYDKLGHNRARVTIEFNDVRERFPETYELLSEDEKTVSGSTWVFVLTFTSDGAAIFTLTITKEGYLPTVIEGFVDFDGDSINVDEFPDELLLPDDPPQASGEDRSGVEVAAAVSASRIGAEDVQTFLVNNPGLQPAAHSPGDWLEPKDGSNQRMMIVGASQSAAATATISRVTTPQLDRSFLKIRNSVSTHAPSIFAGAVVLLGQKANRPVSLTSSSTSSGITQLSVVCMQLDHDIPTRGARYFSQPKAAQGEVQLCQKNCALNETSTIQRCVWQCEANTQ